MAGRHHRSLAYVALAGAAIFWGSNHVVARDVHASVPLAALSFWRWAVALVLLAPVAWPYLKADRRALWAHRRFLVLLGTVGIFIFTLTIYLAAYNTAALNVGLLNATTPIWMLLLAGLSGAERPRPAQWLGVGLSMTGMLVILTKGRPETLIALDFVAGDLWGLAAALIWAIYSLMLRRVPPGLSGYSTLFCAGLAGLALLTPVMLYSVLIVGEPVFSRADDPLPDMLKIAYIGFGPAFLGYLFWNRGVAVLGAATAGVFMYLIPVASAVMAIVFLGERFQLFHALGVALIALGIWRVTRRAPAAGQSDAPSGDTYAPPPPTKPGNGH